MKRVLNFLLVAILVFAFVTGVAACDHGNTGNNTVKVTFDLNYEGAPAATVKEVASGAKVTLPANPTRDGYVFLNWYSDAACTAEADFGRGVTADVKYYAGWRQTVVTVTFNLNYEGSTPLTQNVNIGATAKRPASPTRANYLFVGWYTTAAGTEEFDFATELNTDTIVYAKWEADSGNNVTITYNYNYEGAPNNGVYDTVVQGKNRVFPKNVTAARDGYFFYGWYKDPACLVKPTNTERVNENVTLYALWYDIYTFEAEYIDMDGLEGMGYSGNASGVGMIEKDNYNMNASNGYYVGWLYSPGLTLTFNVTAEAATTNVAIAFRVTAEFQDLRLSADRFQVKVNGISIAYSDINITDVPDGSADAKLPFKTYVLNSNVTLNAGVNRIELVVSNNEKGEGGTMNASAPMVDCIYLYTNTKLSWTPMTSNLG